MRKSLAALAAAAFIATGATAMASQTTSAQHTYHLTKTQAMAKPSAKPMAKPSAKPMAKATTKPKPKATAKPMAKASKAP